MHMWNVTRSGRRILVAIAAASLLQASLGIASPSLAGAATCNLGDGNINWGLFKDLISNYCHRHHTPAADSYKVTHLKSRFGTAIRMRPEDHQLTGSNGRSAANETYRQRQKDIMAEVERLLNEGDVEAAKMKFCEAIEMDRQDIVDLGLAGKIPQDRVNKYLNYLQHLKDDLDALFADMLNRNANNPRVAADEASSEPATSGDGSVVAFVSAASNLVPNDTNSGVDIFVRDRKRGETTLVSVDSAEFQANGNSESPAISDDGRYVVFRSRASNLVDGDTNQADDIFVRDRTLGTTSVVSIGADGSPANDWSWNEPDISGDGRYVAFASLATNLVSSTAPSNLSVFVRDIVSGVTSQASVNLQGGNPNGTSYQPSISGDGRYVAFLSAANDLVAGAIVAGFEVFVRDRTAGVTTRDSLNENGQAIAGDNFSPAISNDGRFVTFETGNPLAEFDENGIRDVYVRDRGTASTLWASQGKVVGQHFLPSFGPSISGTGNYVVFSSDSVLDSTDTNGATDAYEYNVFTRNLGRVSFSDALGQANGATFAQGISSDGRIAVFLSRDRAHFAPFDTNLFSDIYVHEFDILTRSICTVFMASFPDVAAVNE